MTDTVTVHDHAPREDGREVYQERVAGTVDLDGDGAASFTVDLDGVVQEVGVGPLAAADAADGTAEASDASTGSVDVDITGGTANATGVEWEVVVSEDGFYRDSGAL